MATAPKYPPPTDDADTMIADVDASLADIDAKETAFEASADSRIQKRDERLAAGRAARAVLAAALAGLLTPTLEEKGGLLGQVTTAIPETSRRLLSEVDGHVRVLQALHSREVASIETTRKGFATAREKLADRAAGLRAAQDRTDRATAASLARLNARSK